MSTTQSILLAGVCLLAGFAAGWGLTGTEAKATDIRWKYGDAELVIDLEKDMANDQTLLEKIFSEEFSSLGATGWLKTQQGLFLHDDPALVGKLGELDYNSVSARELRELRFRGEGPWAHQFKDIVVSFPGAQYTNKGKANGCSTGPFYRKKVNIFLEEHPDRLVTVNVSDPFPCRGETTRADGSIRRSDIQISHTDAEMLFGDEPLGMYKKAVAIVVD